MLSSRPILLFAGLMFANGAVAFAEAETPHTVSLPGEWLAEDIFGDGVIDNAQTTLEFTKEGKVAGRGGCNRYAGNTTIRGKRISFSPLAATRMACAEALMDQERRFFEALSQVKKFRIDQLESKLYLLDEGGKIVVRLVSM